MPRTPPTQLLTCLAFLSCLAALTGCATTSVTPGTRAVVAVRAAAFYKYGPAQSFGPDFQLNQGAKVTVLKRDWGFTRVMTDDGSAGYVANDDLKPAPSEAPAPGGSSSGVRIPSSGGAKRSYVPPTRGSPLFESGDLAPLPESGDSPKPAPRFRF